MKPVSVLTGATGFIGSHLADLLLENGHKVICITRKTSNLRWLQNKDLEIIDSGLNDAESLKKVLKDANYLFHVAGVVKAKKMEDYINGNVETTKNLLEVLLEVNKNINKIVVVSSQTAAGPSTAEHTKTENDENNPITRYGKSKDMQEKLVRTYMDKLPIAVIRPPAVYGERDTEIYQMFKAVKMGIMTFIGFDKKQVSIINVKDLVRGIYLAGISEKSASQIYFLGSEKMYDWYQISKAMKGAFGKKTLNIKIPHPVVYSVAAIAQFFAMFSKQAATFNIEKARDFVQSYWTCDSSKAYRDFGWKQEISLEDGMRDVVKWYKDNKWL